VLKKVICFLRKEEENLEGQIKYHDLMEKIIMYGNRMKIDLEARKDDLDELSE
jgi:lipopolysaccharide assembly outer membrane protein LptD (OstA)